MVDPGALLGVCWLLANCTPVSKAALLIQALTELNEVRSGLRQNLPTGTVPTNVLSLQRLTGVGRDAVLELVAKFGFVKHFVHTPTLRSAMVCLDAR